jgi:hypothetical protein
MSQEYLEMLRMNIADVFSENNNTDQDNNEIIVYYKFSDESKQKIKSYIESNLENPNDINEKILRILPFESLLIHYLLYLNENFMELNLLEDLDYLAVKYMLLPTYNCYIAENIFGVRYPDEYTITGITNKTDANIIEQIAGNIEQLDDVEIKNTIIENVYEVFVTPAKMVMKDLIFELPEFKDILEYIDEKDLLGALDNMHRIKDFQEYLKRNINKLFEPDYTLPDMLTKTYNNVLDVFKEREIQLKKLHADVKKEIEKCFITDIDLSKVDNEFFRIRYLYALQK